MVRKELISKMREINLIGGQITSRIEAKDESEKYKSVKVLVPKAIANGVVDHTVLCDLDVKINVDEKRFTREGDVVMKLSTPYDACLIGEEDEGLLVPSFCAIINNIPEYLDKKYFVAYLNSKSCQLQVKRNIAGSTIAILSVGAIKKLEIPVPDNNTQVKIAKDYFNVIQKIKLINKIIGLEQEKLDSEFFEMEDR